MGQGRRPGGSSRISRAVVGWRAPPDQIKPGRRSTPRVTGSQSRRRPPAPPHSSLAMADLSARDVERAQFAFSIYDFEGCGTVDAIHVGDMLRALGLNPTLALVEKLGGTKKKNEKKLKADEFLPIYSQAKKEKEVGCYEDFLECLKLYDKQEDGKMLLAELSHTLLSLGERLSDPEVETILKDCCDTEDDDGFIPYAPFLKRVVSGPEEDKPAA
ncbi:myosin light chain 1 isoform X2 [Bacillus rossius redtenbacheri]|uniref:myosin light chain 1 isoform X2 n=1 Tax=Bacillus rossius redtenbacheri TaxID=93214 RepID=UPI002FDDEC2D